MNKSKIMSIIIIVITLIMTIFILTNIVNGTEVNVVNNATDIVTNSNIELTDITGEIFDTDTSNENTKNNMTEEQKMLEEKEKFSQNPTNIITSNDLSIQEEIPLQNNSEVQSNNNIISNVMNKFYPTEYRTICENIEKQINELKEIGNVSESESALLLCDLMIDILKTKTINEKERNALLDYLQGESSNIRDNKQAKEKIITTIEEIMENER